MGFLSDLVDTVRRDLRDRPLDVARLREEAAAGSSVRSFPDAILDAPPPAMIAEVKRASPSAGPIDEEVDPVPRATAYQDGGAAAISVLTERRHFQGSLDDLTRVRGAVGIPVLRKDFLVDPSQLLEARAAGADSVLLITSCLDEPLLADLLWASRELGMEPLVETHSEQDLDRALGTDARVIGVNARDLETLAVDVEGGLARLARVPRDRVRVFESGIRSRSDVAAAARVGASAVLVGEALMRADDPADAIRELLGRDDVRGTETA